jgi:serine protease AprX
MCSNDEQTQQGPLSFGVTWGGLPMHARRFATVAVAAAVGIGVIGPVAAEAATPSSAAKVQVVVQENSGAGNFPEQAVTALGGTVLRHLSVIDGFTASVPSDRLDALRATAGVASVTEDAGLSLSDADVAGSASQVGSLSTIANQVTGASSLYSAGATGKGVDVALVDSGVVPVAGLDGTGKVIYGPDLTEESGTATQNLDTYGHGTHMAGIIAGKDAGATSYAGNTSDFVGMAPDSRIVSIKIADAKGNTDVSQAIAAIDWVVENKNKNGMNIRVMNMSFGTDSTQSYLYDPLAFAAEQAWKAGIVVVVAVGNDGNSVLRVNNPASDPYVIAVGSDDANGTADTKDDTISSFSNNGNGTRNPDVVAPGDHVVSLRDPGSYLDSTFPDARIGTRLFRGSGTSQAAAVVSGSAALLISQRPDLTPDQVKALLMGTAVKVQGAGTPAQGSGLINLAAAAAAPTPTNAVQSFQLSIGTGSLELARGSVHVSVNGKKVTGEVDVRGRAFNSATVAAGIKAHTNWSGLSWSGLSWSGLSWSGLSWSGLSWSGLSWSGLSWSGLSWSGLSWSGLSWSGLSWSGLSWSGLSWSGLSWA